MTTGEDWESHEVLTEHAYVGGNKILAYMKRRLTLSVFFASITWLLSAAWSGAADFWLYGKLPPPHEQASGTMQFKFVYMHTWTPTAFWSNDGTSKDGSEPNASLPLRIVKGRFLAKLPVKQQSVTQSEFLVRVWFAAAAGGVFQQMESDFRLLCAELDPDKKSPPPVDVWITGEVFSSGAKSGDLITLGSGPAFRCWVKKRGKAAAFEYESSSSFTVSVDSRIPTTNSLRIAPENATHVCLRMPQGNPTGTKQVNTEMALQPTTAEQFGESRTWQDVSGRKIIASLRDCDGTVAVLKGADGNLLLVDLSTLSAADQNHAKKARDL
jgi:hypothetical protein